MIKFVINQAKKIIQGVLYVLTEIQRSLLVKVLGMQDRHLERPTRLVKEVVTVHSCKKTFIYFQSFEKTTTYILFC